MAPAPAAIGAILGSPMDHLLPWHKLESLDQIAGLKAVEPLEGHSAVLAAVHLAHTLCEPPQASDAAAPEHPLIPGQPHVAGLGELPFKHLDASDQAELRKHEPGLDSTRTLADPI